MSNLIAKLINQSNVNPKYEAREVLCDIFERGESMGLMLGPDALSTLRDILQGLMNTIEGLPAHISAASVEAKVPRFEVSQEANEVMADMLRRTIEERDVLKIERDSLQEQNDKALSEIGNLTRRLGEMTRHRDDLAALHATSRKEAERIPELQQMADKLRASFDREYAIRKATDEAVLALCKVLFAAKEGGV